MLKYAWVLDVIQPPTLHIRIWLYLLYGNKDQIHESCEWVSITTKIAKIMTGGLIERKVGTC